MAARKATIKKTTGKANVSTDAEGQDNVSDVSESELPGAGPTPPNQMTEEMPQEKVVTIQQQGIGPRDPYPTGDPQVPGTGIEGNPGYPVDPTTPPSTKPIDPDEGNGNPPVDGNPDQGLPPEAGGGNPVTPPVDGNPDQGLPPIAGGGGTGGKHPDNTLPDDGGATPTPQK